MFRKDAGRTAASSEDLRLPLKQEWDWQSTPVVGMSDVSTAVVKGDNIYFTAGPPAASVTGKTSATRVLVCAEAKTGRTKWVRQLTGPRIQPYLAEDVGPAVTESGIIYVIDVAIVKRPCPQPTFVVKAFSEKGELIDFRPLPVKNELDRFFLRDGHGQPNFMLTQNTKPPL